MKQPTPGEIGEFLSLLLSHDIVFQRPERLSGSHWQIHLPFIMLLTELCRPQVFVEVGTTDGDAYCGICQVVRELRLDAKCFSVIGRSDEEGARVFEARNDFKAHHDDRYSSFSTIVEMNPDEASELFGRNEVDLLSIYFQSFEATMTQLDTWRQKMSEHGLLLLYGTGAAETNPEIMKVHEELPGSLRFDLHNGRGLTVLAFGKVVPQMQSLFDAGELEGSIIRKLFRSLGETWDAQARIEALVRERSELQELTLSLAEAAAERAQVIEEDVRPRHGYGPDAAQDFDGYQRVREKWKQESSSRRTALLQKLNALPDVPLISILVPVYQPPLHHFRSCVESVLNQIWPTWELCICDDGSNDPELTAYLRKLQGRDRRIKIGQNPVNRGISHATNVALDLATGEFVTFLDHDDLLDPGAIAEIALVVSGDAEIDIVYSDEDKIDESEIHFAPYFKPDWSPDLLLSHAYITHGLVVRRKLVSELGGLRPEFDGSQDYDLMLRATERARKIFHVPRVLYHWRMIEGSTALDELAKPWAHEAAKRAVEATVRRRWGEGIVETGFFRWAFRPRIKLNGEPLVSIIIPFRDGGGLLKRCVESIHALAGYDNWEALLVDNQSWEPETRAVLNRLRDDPKCRLLSFQEPFNWSVINNWAVRQAKGDYLLFLNNDMQATSDGWLLALLEQAQREEVAAVGSRLVYPDGSIQHAGVIMGIGRVCAHSCWFCPPERHAYFGMDKLIRNYSAVTGACMMVRREVFNELGGFDESLRVAYNDIDFCLRARQRGYLIVYTPFAELMHFESMTRGIATDTVEEAFMMDRWSEWIKRGDPYYNRNLSLRRFDFGLPYESETPPWKDLVSEPEI